MSADIQNENPYSPLLMLFFFLEERKGKLPKMVNLMNSLVLTVVSTRILQQSVGFEMYTEFKRI